jgi:predicted small secreted protein
MHNNRQHGIPPSPHWYRPNGNPIWERASACSLSVTDLEIPTRGNTMCKRTTILTLTLIALLGAAPLLGACHTTAGAGKDISKTGQAIEDEAIEHTP